MTGALQRVRDVSALFFHRFGIHCATHQIRLILISGLVITSLFYPALAIYSSSRFKPLSHVPAQVLGIFTPGTPSLAYFEDDLDNIWTGQRALSVREDSVARARCGMERTIRLERLLVTSTGVGDTGVMNTHTLASALELEDRLTHHLSHLPNPTCLKRNSHECITISPLEFWQHDEYSLRSDTNVLQTINTKNLTVAGLPINIQMVLAGRESDENTKTSVDFASYLSIVYFFVEDDCTGSNGHEVWIQALEDSIPPSAKLITKPQEPQLIALQFDLDKSGQTVSGITVLIYLSYILFFVYYSGSMRRMDTVHSRIGLCFTGLVEILVSTITSLSVCAIGGFRITMVPWSVLPIVLVVVGAESMFRLVDEVVKTPISLPVKERIGVGLSRAGTSNTLRVVSYNTILGVIAFFASGAIRQFCVFAIVVLVAHWFLIHTFFVAVLSIDIQRLELDDLLRQDAALAPSRSPKEQGAGHGTASHAKSSSHISALLKVRLPRNVSLLFLLALTGALYYTTQPAPKQVKEDDQVPSSRASIMRHKEATMKLEAFPEARRIWQFLNPDDDPLVHVRIEAPAIVMLRPHNENQPNTEIRTQRSRLHARVLRPLWWLAKIIVLPIGATISCLYILLLYLLKDADRLEMHRGKTETKEEITSRCDVSFDTLPRTCETDIQLLAANRDCTVIASVSADNQLFVWTSSGRKQAEVNLAEVLASNHASSSTAPTCTALAVSEDGAYVALGVANGLVLLWAVNSLVARLLARPTSGRVISPVKRVHFITLQQAGMNWQDLDPREATCANLGVLAIYEDATVIQWTKVDRTSAAEELRPLSQCHVIRSTLIQAQGSSLPLLAFLLDDGSVEVVNSPQVPSSERVSYYVHPGNPADLVTHAHACVVQIEDASHLILAFALQSGTIILHDVTTDEYITTLDEHVGGTISSIRLVPSPTKACSHCGEVPMCKFYVVFSIGNVVFIERAQLAHRCSCYLSQPLGSKLTTAAAAAAIGRRSRSSSFVSSSALTTPTLTLGGESPPSRTRSRHTSVSSATDEYLKPDAIAANFPISAHGVHSRRGSERETRKACEEREHAYGNGIRSSNGGTGYINNARLSPSPGSCGCGPDGNGTTCSTQWQHLRVVHAKDATCERGGWDIIGQCVIGLRRRSRVKEPPQQQNGAYAVRRQQAHLRARNAAASLTSSTLERWEVWTYDVGKYDGLFSSSFISTLDPSSVSSNKFDSDGSNSERICTPRLSFTRLSAVTVSGPYCLAGFGNTVGIVTVR